MKKYLILIMMFVGLFFPQMAQDQQSGWSVRLKLPQSEYLPGEPIVGLYIEMENMGPKPSPFPGFKGNLFLDASKEPCKFKGLYVDTIPADKSAVVPKKEEKLEEVGTIHMTTWTIDIANYCGLSDGKESFYGVHTLHYRFPEHLGTSVEESTIRFTIQYPAGTNKEAYEYFKGNPLSKPVELLQKFPTSTYAAYAMFGNPGSPRVAMTPEDFLEKVHKPKFLNGAFKTDDNRNILKNEKGENIWLTAEDIQRGIIEKGDLIFKHHPDFVYRDELRFRMAQAYIALYEEKKAVKLFEEIACDAVNESDRQKAKRYMELLVSPEHKGRLLTEEQSEPKKQEMKEPPKK